MTYTGIDISKKYFDADLGSDRPKRFANTSAGIAAFLNVVNRTTMCVMEATGPYSWSLVMALHAEQIAVAMENPLKVRRYAQSLFQRTKTDAVDARMLTRYGEAQHPRAFIAPPPAILQLRQLVAVRDQLIVSDTALNNQIEALTHMPVTDRDALHAVRAVRRTIAAQIERIEASMDALIAKECPALARNLQSIPGIGVKTVRRLVALGGDWSRFATAKEFVAYVGLCPRIYESGSAVKGNRGIIKLGDPRFRAALYMCALSAIRKNPACKEQYLRLRKVGKCKMVALVAVMQKLARQIWAVATTNQPFDPNHSMGKAHAVAA